MSIESAFIKNNDIVVFVLCSRYVPTLDDVEMYKSHKGPVTELHIVDQYMMEVQLLLPHIN